MTDSSHTIHTASGTTPVSEKQFISFEHIAGGVFTFFVALCIFVWNDHSTDFKELKKDVNAIRVIIPTLVTKDEMNARFEKVDEKFEKMDLKIDAVSEKMNEKLDALILSVNTIQNTMATKEDVAANSRAIAKLDKRVTLLEKAAAQ
ncbi:MAG: hypothetical protein ACI8WB_000035 [Phenylobacterium sp.]|jgi:hypothetical protein